MCFKGMIFVRAHQWNRTFHSGDAYRSWCLSPLNRLGGISLNACQSEMRHDGVIGSVAVPYKPNLVQHKCKNFLTFHSCDCFPSRILYSLLEWCDHRWNMYQCFDLIGSKTLKRFVGQQSSVWPLLDKKISCTIMMPLGCFSPCCEFHLDLPERLERLWWFARAMNNF